MAFLEKIKSTYAFNPQSWNLCSYVKGNPVNFNDPMGHGPNVGSYPAYIPNTHSFGMTWFDQFDSGWLPWAGQTAENSWYFGGTRDAFHTYARSQYVSAAWQEFIRISPLSGTTQLADLCKVVSIIDMLLSLGVPPDQLFSVTKQLIETANSVGGASEAPVVIACKDGVVEVKKGDIVRGNSISLADIVNFANTLIENNWAILALGHIHGTTLFPWPSGSQHISHSLQAGDTYAADFFLRTLPGKWSMYYENRIIVLTIGFLFLYRGGAWDIAPLR